MRRPSAISRRAWRWPTCSCAGRSGRGRRGEYVGTSRWLAQQLTNRGFERTRLNYGVKGLAGLSLKAKDYGSRLPYRDD